MKRIMLLVTSCLMTLPAVTSAQDMEGIKCLINPSAAAKAETAVEYNGGKVYFCCGNCAKKFSADPEKFTAAANHQLFATEQVKQKACPISGRPVADGVAAKVGGSEVGLCCKNCLAKVDGAEDMAAKQAIVFSADAFKKGFESAGPDLSKVTCMMMADHAVDAETFVEYREGKVWFCCDGCVEEFEANQDKYAAMANMQLVATGQWVQKGCPFSGGAVTEGVASKIGDMEVGYCCNGCKTKVDNADDDNARIALIFANEAFEKGFEPAKKPE